MFGLCSPERGTLRTGRVPLEAVEPLENVPSNEAKDRDQHIPMSPLEKALSKEDEAKDRDHLIGLSSH